jgi:hypothetical protein
MLQSHIQWIYLWVRVFVVLSFASVILATVSAAHADEDLLPLPKLNDLKETE